MNDTILEQARGLHRTLTMLKNHLLRRHGGGSAGGNGHHCLDLTLPQMSTLLTIRDHGQMTIKEIAESNHVSAPSASAMVDRLVETGMVVREHSQVDRREVLVRLSPQGRDATDRMEEEFLGCIVELMRKVGPETTARWCEVYTRIREVLEDDEEKTPDGATGNPRASEAL